MNNFMDMMPSYLQRSQIFNELLRVKEKQYDKLNEDISDFNNQLFIDTATWGLDIWEKELGIAVDKYKNITERRNNIKAKIRGTGKVGKTMIKNVVDSYTNGGVDVEFEDSTITILFNDIKGRPGNMDDVIYNLEHIIPCHLALHYIYSYFIWNELDKYNKTWDEWDALNLTWEEIEVYREGD